MSSRPTFNQIGAIAIVALVIAAVILAYYFGASHERNSSRTSTPFYDSTGRLYEVSFNQTSFCPQGTNFYGEIVVPWAVTLDNLTIVEPSDSTVGAAVTGTHNVQFSTIVFSVPDGNYSFTIIPSGFNIQTGTVSVSGQDVYIQLHYNVPSCAG